MPIPKSQKSRRVIAFDCETNGLDFDHGTRPFMTMMAESRTLCDTPTETIWSWRVDPYTRRVTIPRQDLLRIRHRILRADEIVGHNVGFDVHALTHAFQDAGIEMEWPWSKVRDTMSSAHLLGSCHTKNLTDQTLRWLNVDVTRLEAEIKRVTVKVRSIVGLKAFEDSTGKAWDKAGKDREDMPSAGEDPWKADMFLPGEFIRAIADGRVDAKWLPEEGGWSRGDDPLEHPWGTKVTAYAGADAITTYHLYKAHLREISRRGLDSIHNARVSVPRLSYELERDGLTLNSERRKTTRGKFKREMKKLSEEAASAAAYPGFDRLPKGNTNLLKKVVFEGLKLKAHRTTATGAKECLHKEVIARWLEELPEDSRELKFVTAFRDFRQRSTTVNYLDSYRKFWIPVRGNDYRLHPSLNPFGTQTLRWSSSRPNEQNISKKTIAGNTSIRDVFGPAPGRVWAALDYNNLELRIPAYESGEEEMIRIFEKPNEPPYWGSYHLMNASIVYEQQFWPLAETEGLFKKTYPDLYGRIKNFGFALSYGATLVENGWGTADRSAGIQYSHRKVADRLHKHSALNAKYVDQANATGFVDTMPDRTVDPSRGYPLQLPLDDWGRIKPTQPLNYHVQGTACWVITRAMEKVSHYFAELNADLEPEDRAFMTAQIHDEIVIDLPESADIDGICFRVADLMRQEGDNVGVPLTVGCTIHRESWESGVDIL